MKKRLLSLLAAAAITLSLSACKPSETAQETQTSETGESAVVETVASADANSTEIHYITDWSIDELVQNIELNGKSYSMPFTVEDLGEGYSIGEKVNLSGDNYGYNLFYNDVSIALISTDKANTNVKKDYIISITVTFIEDIDFKIGDIEFGDTLNDIYSRYGKPSIESENKVACSYLFKNNNKLKDNVLTLIFDNDVLSGISIQYYK